MSESIIIMTEKSYPRKSTRAGLHRGPNQAQVALPGGMRLFRLGICIGLSLAGGSLRHRVRADGVASWYADSDEARLGHLN